MRSSILSIWTFLTLLMGCQSSPANKLVIATAANMQFAMEKITQEFTRETGISCELVVSSSGKLTAQIKEGAPYDLFVAANMAYPKAVYQAGRAEGHPEIYAYGKLVLWTLEDGLEPSLSELANPSIRHIAAANPKTAPYGAAAMQVLEKRGLTASLSDKLVYGESISQTNQYILSGAAEVGFTAMSVVLSPEMKGKGKWTEVDPADYSPIDQGIVLLKHQGKAHPQAREFHKFLRSAKARTILEGFGYEVPRQTAGQP